MKTVKGKERRGAVLRYLDTLDPGRIQLLSEDELMNKYPVSGIGRNKYRNIIRSWAAQQGIGLREAA